MHQTKETEMPTIPVRTAAEVRLDAQYRGTAAGLLVRVGGGEVLGVGLSYGVLRMGRAPDMGLHIAHPTVSWFHGALFVKPDGLFVLDVQSTNGLFVEGRKVEHARLQEGQTFGLGPLVRVNVAHFIPRDGR